MANPLDKYVTTKPGSFARDFRVPSVPSMREAIAGKTLTEALSHLDGQFEAWRKNFEQSISERLRQEATSAASSSSSSSTSTSASTVTASAPKAPVTSVNGKIGDVVLNSDDIAEGLVNFYLTIARWFEIFDSVGFHQNTIPLGEVVSIASDRNLVMYGPLVVDGFMTISGHFVNLTV